MIALVTTWPALAVAAALAQAPLTVDQLRALARDAPDSVLVERARRQPMNLLGVLEEDTESGGGL